MQGPLTSWKCLDIYLLHLLIRTAEYTVTHYEIFKYNIWNVGEIAWKHIVS